MGILHKPITSRCGLLSIMILELIVRQESLNARFHEMLVVILGESLPMFPLQSVCATPGYNLPMICPTGSTCVNSVWLATALQTAWFGHSPILLYATPLLTTWLNRPLNICLHPMTFCWWIVFWSLGEIICGCSWSISSEFSEMRSALEHFSECTSMSVPIGFDHVVLRPRIFL